MTPPKPTSAELAILHVLWKRGASTVREVHDVLGGEQGIGYTTVLKQMQIMRKKGLVRCDTSRMTHSYEAAVSEAETQTHLVEDLLDDAFHGSAGMLVLRALSARRSTPEELAEIRKLIEELERRGS
ncbi:MAG: BlaI/MecI/CopY family transcriptional regulator [Rhodothermales bacterium]